MAARNGNSDANRDEQSTRLEAFISRAKGGSTSALGRALNACRPGLLRSARRHIGRTLRVETGASDIVQDALVNATRGFPRFRGRHAGEFISWLRTILANRLAEIARRARPRIHVSSDAGHPGEGLRPESLDLESSPSSIACNQEFADLIRAGVARLSPRDRQVLGLRFHEQLTFQQIGDQLGLQHDAARMLLTRAVKRLKRELPGHPL